MVQDCEIIEYEEPYKEKLIAFSNKKLSTYQFLQSHYQLRRATIEEIIESMDFQPKFLIIALDDSKIVGYIYANSRSSLPFQTIIPEHFTINTIIVDDQYPATAEILLQYFIKSNEKWQYKQVMMVTGPAWGIDQQQIEQTGFVRLNSSHFILNFMVTGNTYQFDKQLSTKITEYQHHAQFPLDITNIPGKQQEIDTLNYRLTHLQEYGIITYEEEGDPVAIMIFAIPAKSLQILQIIAPQQLNRQLILENMIRAALDHAEANKLISVNIPDIFKATFSKQLQDLGAERLQALSQYILNDTGYRAKLPAEFSRV